MLILKNATSGPETKGTVTVTHIVVQKPLEFGKIHGYPDENMPFCIYGSAKEMHIDHQLTMYPNIQLSAENVGVSLHIPDSELAKGVPFDVTDLDLPKSIPIQEKAMQPLAEDDNNFPSDFFFGKGSRFTIKIRTDGQLQSGSLTLAGNVYRDRYLVNRDPNEHSNPAPAWLAEFRKIGKSIEVGAE